MKRVLVVGAFTFIGFTVVKRLLQEGVEVIGLDQEQPEHLSKWNEEKLMLIGRNSNFTYYSMHDREEFAKDVDTIYICYCEPDRKDYDEFDIQSMLDLCQSHSIRLVLLSSISKSYQRLEEQVTTVTNHIILRVPTVYGPWQPSSMVFQQLLEAELRQDTITVHVNECIDDAVFVEDVAECMLLCGTSNCCGTFHIESNEKGAWEQGLAILQGGNTIVFPKESETLERNVPFTYKPTYLVETGIQEQKNHVMKYRYLYTSNT
ncbi:NAD-dependent epimerase/dehydratase family protein [Ectobacillus polymachus]|uniref:NAD-dependent epimerase/dehydratase family protein n=1 Tax=Ectobacillus polymachus TaxID=1508806 RepID=UPI003A844CC0